MAERFITREQVAFVVGAVQSGVANAISQVCQKYGVVYFNTNSSSTTESAKDCHRTKFVWDGNSHNFALAVVKASVDKYGKNWLLLTNDYVWGINTSKATRAEIEASGGKVIDELFVSTLSREPSPEERALAVSFLEADRVQGAQNVEWALLNLVEFLYNF